MEDKNLYKKADNSVGDKSNFDRMVAVGVTVLFALLLMLFLYFGEIGFSREDMAAASTPEIAAEDDELFLEPELIDVGEPDPEVEEQAAPEALGEPEKAPETEVRIPEVKGDNPVKAAPKEKLVTQDKPSPVTATTPSGKETKKVSDPLAGVFSPNNGKPTGKAESAGAGGTSVGTSGTANGWVFKGCPKPSVAVKNKVTVTVKVTVNEKGNVISAKASGGTAEINAACEAAARQAKWNPTDPATAQKASGTITFTVVPK